MVEKKERIAPGRRLLNWSFGLPVFASLMLATVYPSVASQATPASGPIPVRIVTQPALPQAPSWIARAKGYFEQEGLQITDWKVFTSGPAMLEALGAGETDIAFTGTMPFLTAIARLPVQVIVTGGAGGARHSLVVLKDSPHRSLDDLVKSAKKEGRRPRIGLKKGSSADAAFPQVVRKYGFDYRDFEVIDLDPAGIAAALKTRQVDGTFFWEPYNAIPVVAQGIGRRIADAVGFEDSTGPVVSTGWLKKYGDKAAMGFVKAMIRAQHFIVTQPEEAARILHEAQPKMSLDVWKDTMQRIYWTYRMDAWQREVWKAIESWMLQAGKISKAMPWDQVLNEQYYKRAEQELKPLVAELETNNFAQPGSPYKDFLPARDVKIY